MLLDEITRADTQALGVPLPDPVTGDKRLRTLCEAVLRAPGARATLGEWARDTGASERTMARLFREQLGLSYPQWRQQVVLAHALPMLARGAPVSQVACCQRLRQRQRLHGHVQGRHGPSSECISGLNCRHNVVLQTRLRSFLKELPPCAVDVA